MNIFHKTKTKKRKKMETFRKDRIESNPEHKISKREIILEI